MLHTFISILQIIVTVILVLLMAVQTDKAEQGGGGVMGLGAASGRSSDSVNMLVGAERILKPMTTWAAAGFIAVSVLNAIPATRLTVVHVLTAVIMYLLVMLLGGRIWAAFTGIFGR